MATTAEVEQAYVRPALRGRGTGGALVRGRRARRAAASETFIVADDEGDPKRLYLRLGFRPVWIQHEFTRRPSRARQSVDRQPAAAGEVARAAQVAAEGGVGDRPDVPRVRVLGRDRHGEVGRPVRALLVELGELVRA